MLKNKKFDRLILGIFVVMVLAAVILRVYQFFNSREKVEIMIGSQKISAEVAKTPDTHAKGLSGRESLGEGRGMLFIFNSSAKQIFWMRGMQFPLDFIWIRGDEIRDLSPNVPTDYPGLLTPKEEVDKVLEVNSGFIEKYRIMIGDKIIIN